MNNKIKVSLIQMSSISRDVEGNLEIALKLAKKGVENGSKLVVFPELFDSGYCVELEDYKYASDFENFEDSKTLTTLLDFCLKYQVYVVGSIIERDSHNKVFYDTAFILSQKGLVGKYRKIYLWGDEIRRFCRGEDYPVFSLDFGGFRAKVGLQICYEIGFSEGARILGLKGADILIFPSAFGRARLYAWNLASRARALENGVFVLAVNQSRSQISQFTHQKINFAANSQIINPQGEVLARARKSNEVLICGLDLGECAKQRKAIPYLQDMDVSLQIKALQSLENRL